MKFVFILSVGRSGSTLLQGILNSIPGFLIRGENNNFLIGQYLSYQSLCTAKRHSFYKTDATHPWFGSESFSKEKLFFDIRRLTTNQLIGDMDECDVRGLGFKEIRYLSSELMGVSIQSYLRFLTNVFPDCRFILLTRDIEEIISSGWWVEADPVELRIEIKAFYFATKAAEIENLFTIDYSDLTLNSEKIIRLFEFLDEPLDQRALERVLSYKHSYDTSDIDVLKRENEALLTELNKLLDLRR